MPPHSTVARVFPWGFLLVFAYGFAKQVDELEELNDREFLTQEILFAIVFLVILLALFVYMQKTWPTALPSNTGKNISLAAKFVHRGVYLSLSMLAVTGLMIG
jgi:cytochrome b561